MSNGGKFITCLFLLVFYLIFFTETSTAQITVTADSSIVGNNNVFEITIRHPQSYNNNWEDVSVSAVFQGPDTIAIKGFFYNTNIWKVRFSPPKTGNWSYSLTFKTPSDLYTATGSLTSVQSDRKGFLKRHPNNPFRLIYPDGTLFNGIGLEDCFLDANNNGTPLDDFGFDGGFRTASYIGSLTTLSNYMRAYGANGANFNLYRWTTNNCSFGLYNTISTTGNTYLVKEGMDGDSLVRTLQLNKIRIWLTFFGPPVYGNIDGSTPLEDAAVERYIDYIVARYGAYVDIWELFNESSATPYYYTTISNYLRSIDPYHRLISVSDERPQLPVIDINSPHWYEKESELESDARAFEMITSRKKYNKPIIFGEQGNSVQNWDTLSAVRMRLRSWTAFFAEGTLIFWNTSFAKDFQEPISANIYLGPVERGYINALQNFTVLVDSTATIIKINPSNTSMVRAYGLGCAGSTLGYFHHFNTHANSVNTSFKIRLKRSATIYWINPADNTIVATQRLAYGNQTISSPNFVIDIAMRIVFDAENSPFDVSQKLDLLVYPNPASTAIAINGNFNGTATLSIYDISGRRVFTKTNVANDEFIEIGRLANGVYLYRIATGTRQSAGKLIIANR